MLFETDDLVSRKNEKSFILCLLEVARIGFKVGMPTPLIIQLEQEIDREIENDAKLQKQLEIDHARDSNNDHHFADSLSDNNNPEVSNDNCDDAQALHTQQTSELNNNDEENRREQTEANAGEQQLNSKTAHDASEEAETSEDYGPKPQLVLNDLMNLHERVSCHTLLYIILLAHAIQANTFSSFQGFMFEFFFIPPSHGTGLLSFAFTTDRD